MADLTKSPAAESPTTARPLEMDDDDVQDASIAADDAAAGPKTPSGEDAGAGAGAGAGAAASAGASTGTSAAVATTAPTADAAASTKTDATPSDDAPPPPKPPRPTSEKQKNEQTLQEAFPTVDLPVIKAVLTASRGNIEAAFHALLQMTDPDAVEREPTPPPPPPRPTAQQYPNAEYLAAGVPPGPAPGSGRLSPNSQLAADEQLARKLAQHFESEDGRYEARTSQYGSRYPPRGSSRAETDLKPHEMWGEKEHSFLDDDLPVIRENLRKGFVETQSKFNSWVSGIKKRIDEEFNSGNDDDDDDNDDARRRPYGGRPAPGYGRPRRSGDYDADPQVLSDDFAGIQLNSDGARNPNLFRPPPSTSPRPGGRKVAFVSDGNESDDMYNASPTVPSKDGSASAAATTAFPGSGSKSSKWQPMSTVDTTPMGDNDPFSLGDSDDEKDVATTATATKKDDGGKEGAVAANSDAERLRKAAAEAMEDSLVEDKSKTSN